MKPYIFRLFTQARIPSPYACAAHLFAATVLLHSNLRADPPLDRVTVIGSPISELAFESALPVTVIEQLELQLKSQPSLGETLADELGVSSTFYGMVASRPVIRGLDSNRIRIQSDGASLFDVSNTSPDHAVSVESLAVTKIEIVRGPAALQYGTNAVGGLINTTTNRIPRSAIPVPFSGVAAASYSSVNEGQAYAGLLEGGWNGFNYHVDASYRYAENYSFPGDKRSANLQRLDPLPPGETEISGRLPDSGFNIRQISGGLSYTWKRGYFGASASFYSSIYGVPGFEQGIKIDLRQIQYNLSGRFDQPISFLKSIDYLFSLGRYTHQEVSADEGIGTVFNNNGYEGRIEFRNVKLGGLEGVLGYQIQESNFSAIGDEAFQQPTGTLNHGVFLFQEYNFKPFRFEVGARYDHVRVKSSLFSDPDDPASRSNVRRTFNAFSAAAGLVWIPTDDYSAALSLSYTQRPPTGQELFANGPHLATGQFEVGSPNFGTENSLAIDVSLRKRTGWVTGEANFFYYRFKSYVDLIDTGRVNDVFGIPIFQFSGIPASFIGFEAAAQIHLLGPVTIDAAPAQRSKAVAAAGQGAVKETALVKPKRDLFLELRGDYTQAENRDTRIPLPRIPPLRLGAALVYNTNRISARVDFRYVFEQDRVAALETKTPGYPDLTASVQYQFATGPVGWMAFVRGTNLTNAEQRSAVSFLKDVTPLPGRGVTLGLRAAF